MKPRLFSITLALALILSSTAHAKCYADYKAKRENPLKLHYGVMQVEISPCTMTEKVSKDVSDRLSSAGWQLLQVQSVFGEDGLGGKRKQDAGQFFLRF